MPFSCPDFGALKIGPKTGKTAGGAIFTRLCSCEGTQGLTRRNTGRFGWGWYHYPRSALRAAETPDGRLPKGLICRFPGLVTSSLISAA